MSSLRRGDVVVYKDDPNMSITTMLFYVDGFVPGDPHMAFVARVCCRTGWGLSLAICELEVVGHVDEELERRVYAFMPADMYKFKGALEEACARNYPIDPKWLL